MNKEITYTSVGESLIEIPEDFIKGSVRVEGYTVEEVAGSNYIVVTPEPAHGAVLTIRYTAKKRQRPRVEQKTIEQESILGLQKRVGALEEETQRILKALDIRATERQVELGIRAIMNEILLIKEHVGLK